MKIKWLIILLISVNFCDVLVFMPTQLRSCELLGVHIAGCHASCQDWCSALSSCINWPNRLIEQCNITPRHFIPTLARTVVIYYPLLHNLVCFGICSDELHQRLVRSFIFPGRLEFSIMKVKQHCCPHPPPGLKLAECKLSNVCLNRHWKQVPAVRVSDIFKNGWSQESLLSAGKHSEVVVRFGC